MQSQEKLSREEILAQLNITDDILSSYENELEISAGVGTDVLETYTTEDFDSIKTLHKLRESGLTYNEIKLLSSFSGVLKNVDLEESVQVKELLSLSPTYRVKQSLNLAKKELESLRKKASELEEALNREIELRSSNDADSIALLKSEIDTKQKSLNALDRRLSETLQEKSLLEVELKLHKNGKTDLSQIKGKKTKELYKMITEKDLALSELSTKNKELEDNLNKSKEEHLELKDRIEFMEDEFSEMELEIEERYHEQITNLREQIEGLIEKKQYEWETHYTKTGEQHRKEILTLQRKHEQDMKRLKETMRAQLEEIEYLRTHRNPFSGLLKMGAKR